MIRYGKIADRDTAKARVRVQFEEDNLLSPWLAVSVPGTKDDQHYRMPDKDEHVWCLLDEHSNTGIVGGAIYSDDNAPSAAGEDKQSVTFKDGTKIEYDRAGHKLTVTVNTTKLTMEQDGFTIERGSESLKKLLSDTLDKILALTVTTPNGPSGTPINFADFTAIKNRIPNLLKG